MVNSCVVYGCNSKPRHLVSLHEFPSEKYRCRQWIKFVRQRREGWSPSKYSQICSKHFERDDFSNLLKVQNHLSKRLVLTDGAVPTICPEGTSSTNTEDSTGSFMMPSVREKGVIRDERSGHNPLSDPLAEDDNVDLIPEFEVKEEPYDFYEDNITDTGSPCWISDGVTLIGENDDDLELEDGIQLEDNRDPFDYVDDESNNIQHEEELDIMPTVQKLPKKGGRRKQKQFQNPRKSKKRFAPYEVDIDDDMDDGLMVTVENASMYKDEMDDLGWKKNKRLSDSEMTRRRRELENLLMECKVNMKVMQARLDEERGKMMRIQNSLINLRRRQKRHELKRMQFAGSENETLDESMHSTKSSQMNLERKGSHLVKSEFDDERRKFEELMETKLRMARLREMKARKALEQKTSGVVDYQKELETKLKMARLREIKAKKALEKKLNDDKQLPVANVKMKVKPLKLPKQERLPKQEECVNGEDYEKLLEGKLKIARIREMKAMKALERANEEGDKTEKIKVKKPKVKRLKMMKMKMKMKMKAAKPLDEEKALEMKLKMSKLREIKAEKALERKRLEDLGMVPVKEKNEKKKGKEKKKKVEAEKRQEFVATSGEGENKEDGDITENAEEKETKPEIHIATSHMLWNVLSRIKMEPYQESTSKTNPGETSSSYLSNQTKNNNPLPSSDIPKLVKDFMCRDDVSKVSTTSPYATRSDKSLVRYRMHYLPILHKQFEAENGNVCSYASFCSYVPESVIKPHGWQWKFCPCLPCINPELKFEKMISEEILKMEGIELGDILHDDAKENMLMVQLKALRDSRQFFTYDSWERNSSGTINAKRRTASEPITIVVGKFLEELSVLKSHIQRSFYQYHAAKLARDRSLHCADEVTLHIECSPLSVYRNPGTEHSSSDPAAVFTFLTGYLWSQSCEQALAAVSDNKDYSTSGIWAGLEKILLSVVMAGKKKINIISDCPTSKYRNKSNFYYMSDFARKYGVCFRWIFLELSHQIGNANMIRDDIDRTIKEQMNENPDISLAKSEVQKMLQSHTSIIVDSYSHEDVQKYKLNLPKLKVVQGTQKFDEVIILPEDFWVRDVIGFDTFKKLPF